MVGSGVGSLPRIIAEAAVAVGRPLAGYVEVGDDPQPPTRPVPRLGDARLLSEPLFLSENELVVAIQGSERRALCQALLARGATCPPLVHPEAHISPSARLGAGTVVSAGVVVQQDAAIGRFCLLNTGCTIDHDNVVGDFTSVSPGAHTAGGVTIGEEAFIGLGALVLNRVHVGRRATVGAGAVVLRDVDDGATVVGNPARPLVKRPRT